MSIKTFFVDLQNAEPKKKLRWLIILSAASFLVIMGLWLGYRNLTGASTESGLVRKEHEPSFFQKIGINIASGVNILRRRTANTIYFFSQKFTQKNTIELTPEEQQPTTE